jgi:small subunit ribosomal protein S2
VVVVLICPPVRSVPEMEKLASITQGGTSGFSSTDSLSVRNELTIRHLMNAGLHLGHSSQAWHQNMLPYVYGRRADIHIINLEHTLVHLRRAISVTREIARRGGIVLFVGSRPFLQDVTYEAAIRSHQFYVNERWMVGTIANSATTLGRGKTGAKAMSPDLVIVLDMPNNKQCIEEATTSLIPIIAISDTDCDPQSVTYPIPANDDSIGSAELIANVLSTAALEGYNQRKTMLNEYTSLQRPNLKSGTSQRARFY